MSADRNMVHRPADQALKVAWRKLVEAYGGQVAAAAYLGRGQSLISDYGNVNTAPFAPVNLIAALEAVTHGLPGHPIMTRELARAAGYMLVPMPQAEGVSTGAVMQLVAAQAKEAGGVTASAIDALADGHYSAAEIADTRAKLALAQQHYAVLDALLAQLSEQQAGA